MSAYIIAEMAWSHAGSPERAMQIVEGAARAGADAISIHITNMPSYMVEDYKCIAGATLSDSSEQSGTIYEFLDSINLDQTSWKVFDNRASQLGIEVVVMCNDRISFEFSKQMKVSRYVLSAATFLEFDLVADIVRQNPDLILRIGGATLNEIQEVLGRIFEINADAKVCLLAGIQLYPTPIEELHLASLSTLSKQFERPGVTIGLADHIDGDHPYAIYLPVLALAMGATVLEKHITTDRKEKLEDYEAALGIDQFAMFVDYVRTAESAIGNGSIDYMSDSPSYYKYRMVSRKKIVAAIDLEPGTMLKREMLVFRRADYGAQLDALDSMLGKPLKVAKRRGQGVDVDEV